MPLTKVDAQLLEGAITANSSGNVGIGTSSPTTKLNIVDGSATVNVRLESGSVVGQYFASSSGGAVFLDTASSHPLVFRTNITERMRIDTSGVVTSSLGGMQVISGTAVTASGTSVDFTGIPSWVKRITVMINSLSTNGSSIPQIQLGTSSGVATTGYSGHAAAINSGTGQTGVTSGHIINNGSTAPSGFCGHVVFTNINSNNWVGSGLVLNTLASGAMAMSASIVGLSGTLDRVRITTVNGTDAFDAGVINILYE